ncbi:conserved hypothetical protein [Ricinus communis]|uniref:Uncharacterized protein n=1 Tax=Ricinus communis TaxID=3988 RepID=B9SNX2_RICCO|nr:conserved hypothetical protein [Ricinus communis]
MVSLNHFNKRKWKVIFRVLRLQGTLVNNLLFLAKASSKEANRVNKLVMSFYGASGQMVLLTLDALKNIWVYR